jgi:hypothetical protein
VKLKKLKKFFVTLEKTIKFVLKIESHKDKVPKNHAIRPERQKRDKDPYILNMRS